MYKFTVTQLREDALRDEVLETADYEFETLDGAAAWFRASLTTIVGITLDSGIRPYADRLAANRLRASCQQLMAEHIALASTSSDKDRHLAHAFSIDARAAAAYSRTSEDMDALRSEFDLAYGRMRGAGA
jgi:hypothetical protein